jgi:alpha-galactosidase
MLYYAPQIWCSDNSDALDRISIQMGTSLFYPSSAMGAHVSVCPNHQTRRTVPFTMRGHVALSGTFGYELDITKLSDEEKELVRQQIQNYHEWNDIVREGNHYRLTENFGQTNIAAWSWVSQDQKEVLVTVIRKNSEPCGINPPLHLKLRGLDPDKLYELDDKRRSHGKTLMNAGIRIPNAMQDAFSIIFHLNATE